MVPEDQLRKTMRMFATGVTLLTTLKEDGSVKAMTVNSFTSVSLKPPLVLVSVGHGRSTLKYIQSSGRYSINVMGRTQSAAARFFAEDEHERTGDGPVRYSFTPRGSPMVDGCIAFLDCEVVSVHEHGDHTVFVGEVKDSSAERGDPLLFYEGQYLGLNGP